LWALGGIAAQELFSRHHVDPGWLAGVRMACGGLLLLVAFRPAWPRRHAGLLIAVAVVGIAGAQYTWFAAIDKSNVALATFVQYIAVPMTAGWQMLRRQVQPAVRRLTAVAFSFYLLASARLARDTGARPATAWGLSIGAIPMLLLFPPWTAHPSGDPLVVAGLTGSSRWPPPRSPSACHLPASGESRPPSSP
jgi:drug/metabolite transporter (DMT)-like permease